MTRTRKVCVLVAFCCAYLAGSSSRAQSVDQVDKSVRVAAIGEINDFGFWDELSRRFERASGIHVETVATGNKDAMPALFRQGVIDLITMQSSDAVMELVADGWAIDPQPWLQINLILVGPRDDPAKIKGMTDAADAIKKIVDTKSAFVIHASAGADDIVRSIVQTAGIKLDPDATTILLNDHQRQVFQIAIEKNAYTFISRVPFKSGKLSAGNFVAMVEGDAKLRRPYILAVANPEKTVNGHPVEAKALAAFLRSEPTQTFINEFGKEKIDPQPLFIPVESSTANKAAIVPRAQ